MMPSTSAAEPGAAHRDAADDGRVRLVVVGERRDERGLRVGGDDGVHADAVAGVGGRDGATEPVHAGLRRAVRGEDVALAAHARWGCREDDRAAAVREHRAHRVLQRQERAGEVDVDGAPPHLEVEVGGLGVLAEELHAGVRDDDVGDSSRRPRARRRRRRRMPRRRCPWRRPAPRRRVRRRSRRAPASSRSAKATRAPFRRKRSATWRPIPEAAPVTSAVFPVSRSDMSALPSESSSITGSPVYRTGYRVDPSPTTPDVTCGRAGGRLFARPEQRGSPSLASSWPSCASSSRPPFPSRSASSSRAQSRASSSCATSHSCRRNSIPPTTPATRRSAARPSSRRGSSDSSTRPTRSTDSPTSRPNSCGAPSRRTPGCAGCTRRPLAAAAR